MSVFRLYPPSLHQNPERPHHRWEKAQKRRFILSYAFDWAITVCLWIAFAFIDDIDGFKRQFSLTDTSLQHTHALHERVPVWLLVVLVFVVPVVIMAVISLGLRRSLFDFHAAFLGIVLAQSITWVATDAFKITVGRPRPDLIDRCRPADGAANASPFGLATYAICTRTDLLKDGFRSFPSGHSSSSFAGLGFLSLYLAAKFHMFDNHGHAAPAWIAAAPLIGACLIAISRTMDYRHHATDVLSGGILGLVVSWICYRMYFPPLSDEQCHEPYRSRLVLFADEGDAQANREEQLPLSGTYHAAGLSTHSRTESVDAGNGNVV